MKTTSLFISPLLFLTFASGAHAYSSHIYANTISAHNISVLQHTITQTAFNSFEGSMATHLGQQQTSNLPAPNSPDLYGRAPMYGAAPVYGEYNDDGLAGRSGGDGLNTNAALNSIWFNWQHLGDNAKFDDFSRLNTKYDMVMMGLAGGRAKMGNGISEWGLYTGYVGGTLENSDISIDGQGGYFGVYNGFSIGVFNLSTTINGGVIDNASDTQNGTDDFTNFWVGGAINATYDIALDNTFTLQPGIHAGYTWIKSENYTSVSGDLIENDAFSMLELSPEIRAIKHIGNGWFGSLNAKYAMIFANGGDIVVNDNSISELEIGNFVEYSISLEKSISNVNMSANFGRRDGARDGWIGGLNIKVIF